MTSAPVTPLRRRMIDDMRLRHYGEKTQHDYVREVAAFAFPLADKFKVQGRYGKWLLRKWLEGACPAAEPFARKQGFTVPVAHWIAPRAADLARSLPEHPGIRAFCDPEAVRAAFEDEKRSARWWPLLFFALWWSIQIDRAEPVEALAGLVSQ